MRGEEALEAEKAAFQDFKTEMQRQVELLRTEVHERQANYQKKYKRTKNVM